jgi:hypothetical protein
MSTLYYGDNLDILRPYIKDESGDYLTMLSARLIELLRSLIRSFQI